MQHSHGRHAKPLTNEQNTLLDLRKHILEARLQLQKTEEQRMIKQKTVIKTRDLVKEHEVSSQEYDDIESMVFIPKPYVSHYNHQPITSNLKDWLLARFRGLFSITLLISLIILQWYRIWGTTVGTEKARLVEYVQWVCLWLWLFRVGCFLRCGGLRNFLNS